MTALAPQTQKRTTSRNTSNTTAAPAISKCWQKSTAAPGNVQRPNLYRVILPDDQRTILRQPRQAKQCGDNKEHGEQQARTCQPALVDGASKVYMQ